MARSLIKAKYEKVRDICKADYKGEEAGAAILELATLALQYLVGDCERIDLISMVPGKSYFTYRNREYIARPTNLEYFEADEREIARLWNEWSIGTISPEDFGRLSYTIALAPCLAMELFDRQNKKGPATYFECYVAHLFAKAVGVNPTKRALLPVQDKEVRLTMDFLLDVGDQFPNVHLPVKMSTRERAVQAWSHQRMLDASYGDGKYRGVMVCFSETKLNLKSLEVVEICVPDQWLAFQTLIATLDRIYYFDAPLVYQRLARNYPNVITIREFQEFFVEKDALLRSWSEL